MSDTPGISGASEDVADNLRAQRKALTDTPSMRERLARHLHNHDREMVVHSDRWPDWQSTEQAIRDIYLSRVDAILTELQESSLDLLFAMAEVSPGKLPRSNETRWKSAIQHIRDGGS